MKKLFITLVVIGVLAALSVWVLKTLHEVGLIGRTPAPVAEVRVPRVTAPLPKAPTVSIPQTAPKNSEKPKRRAPTSRSVPMESPSADDSVSTPPSPSVETAPSVPKVPAVQAFVAKLPDNPRDSVGKGILIAEFTVRRVEVTPRTPEVDQDKVEISMNIRSRTKYAVELSQHRFYLSVDGKQYEPIEGFFFDSVPAGEVQEKVLTFAIPAGSARVGLEIKDLSGNRGRIPLDLTPPPPPQSASPSNDTV